jgi:2-methylcitrate dehydratase PrpD
MTDVDSAVEELALFVSGMRDDDIPAPTRLRAAHVIADTLGVMLRGSATEDASRLISQKNSAGACTVVSQLFPEVGIDEAVLLNAVSTCSTELDEGTRPTGHPAMHILPAVLAAAQAARLTGEAFLTAFVVGYEVQARLQMAAHLRAPVHCHGNYGHVGAAAALSRLRGADGQDTATAMNGAAGFASATSYSLPYAGASMHSAAPAMSGITALIVDRLVRAGFSAFRGSVREVFGSILGDCIDAAPLVDDLGKGWAVDQGYVKFHSTCGHVHPVIESLADALRKPGGATGFPWHLGDRIEPETIQSVTVRVGVRASELDGLPEVMTPLAARFSIPFSVATAIAHGAADASAFEGDALTDPGIRALAERVHIRSDAAFDGVFPALHRARVEIRFRDGRVARGSCENPYGNPQNRASDKHVRAKFDALVGEVMSPDDAASLWQAAIEVDARRSMAGFPQPE